MEQQPENKENIEKKEENCKKKSYGIGNLFKGNLEQDIIKLKMTKGYDRIFNFIKTNSTNENLYKERIPKKSGKNRNKIQVMTSRELKKKLKYNYLKNQIFLKILKEFLQRLFLLKDRDKKNHLPNCYHYRFVYK